MRAVSSAFSDEVAHPSPVEPIGTDREIACQINVLLPLQKAVDSLKQSWSELYSGKEGEGHRINQ
jgi:hypothetical protein